MTEQDMLLELESAHETVEGYICHFRAALMIGNKINAERNRQSAVSAFESYLDTFQKYATIAHRSSNRDRG